MKKTSILSLATAAALVATTAGTLATWDMLTAEQAVTLTYGEPVKVNMTTVTGSSENLSNGVNGVQELNLEFSVNVAGLSAKAGDKIVLTTDGGAATNVKVTFAEGGTDLANGIDESVIVGENTYTAKVKLNSDVLVAPTAKDLKIKAELQPATPTIP